MTAKSTTRSVVCLLLFLSLCAPILASTAPAADRDRATEFRALAAPLPAVLLARDGRHSDARQRPSVPSLFTLVTLDGRAADPGRFAAAIEDDAPRSLWAAGPKPGRSPPPIS